MFAKVLTLALLATSAICAPLREVRSSKAIQRRAFVEQDYADFQISSGVAGNAQEEAAAVFVAPFEGVDLTTVTEEEIDAVATMREAAEDAETSLFNPAIDAAEDEETADALQVGKIKNKVLKLTGITQLIKIQIAQAEANGDDASERVAKLAEEQTKLDKNIATDKASAGAASLPIV